MKYTDPDGKVAALDDVTIAAAIVVTTGVIAMANNQSYKDSADKDKNNNTGAYTINFESEMKYHGKGGQKRSMQSAMRISFTYDDMPVNIDWMPSSNHREPLRMNMSDWQQMIAHHLRKLE
ncbi:MULTISPECIES: hypothetical protein [unclassified Treponema]|uniref:hypothetical protein n=1 Tax=unclassified Treponema TaxID=2638727 RepID=UPI0005301047|nr:MULTISPECIES: hypothetical protein [unclassified Treponema]AIW89631.1 hypothetical protein JO41_07370 [Treponema sp. OMZ 838]UTC50329.1 hypothetical protein E4N65_09605 [Treponema sp. OMZ 855]